MNKKWGLSLLAFAVAGLTVAGCGTTKDSANGETGGDGKTPAPAPAPQISSDPVELSIYFSTGAPNDAEFADVYVNPLKQKYPHITLKRATGKIEDLVAAGETPDLIYTHAGAMYLFDDLRLLGDLKPQLDKLKVDLSRYDQTALKALEQATPGHLSSLPFLLNLKALYYNKDLFDKFGVEYPKDGMTWEDTIDLAKRVSREDGGVQYKGFVSYALTSMQRQYGNPFYDPKTMKGMLDSPDWKYLFETFTSIYRIPGNELGRPISTTGTTQFMKDRNLAMVAQNNLIVQLEEPSKTGLNWDVAQHPSFKTKPNIMTDVDAHLIAISATSKHKDQAMQALLSITSDEAQMMLAQRYAKVPALADPKFKAAFAKEMPHTQGKHIASIFKSGITITPYRDAIVGKAGPIIDKAFDLVYHENKDINSALRDANEEFNLAIAQEQSKKK